MHQNLPSLLTVLEIRDSMLVTLDDENFQVTERL